MGLANLVQNIDNQIIQIRTKSLDVSFNELYDMYKDGELAIAPDYQRLFRWDEEKQSRFIESLILEICKMGKQHKKCYGKYCAKNIFLC